MKTTALFLFLFFFSCPALAFAQTRGGLDAASAPSRAQALERFANDKTGGDPMPYAEAIVRASRDIASVDTIVLLRAHGAKALERIDAALDAKPAAPVDTRLQWLETKLRVLKTLPGPSPDAAGLDDLIARIVSSAKTQSQIGYASAEREIRVMRDLETSATSTLAGRRGATGRRGAGAGSRAAAANGRRGRGVRGAAEPTPAPAPRTGIASSAALGLGAAKSDPASSDKLNELLDVGASGTPMDSELGRLRATFYNEIVRLVGEYGAATGLTAERFVLMMVEYGIHTTPPLAESLNKLPHEP